ncbi:MAG TPA: methylmalonyl Co-A mutase-associated GTPase MeaB, partial [Solirubrobacterales bacterium]|nr:methylmalonyl Co-A mutase-associated GTPase MeaB [Solirubrobacterales bacterium]
MNTNTLDAGDLASRVQAGDKRALARVISWVENGDPRLRSVLKDLTPAAASTRVIGLTGAPGAGKSTVTSALVRAFRARGNRVAVLAVDPSSPFTGGALLGDRVRMQEHATDDGVFIRSMGSRGQLGGLAAATPQAIRVLQAAGYEVILVETVGVGQAEVEIASAADSTVVLVVPGMGDSIQAAKAGVLEVADVLVVNKADRPDTQATLRDLRAMVSLARGEWKPPIVPTVATTGEGVEDLLGQLDRHDG